MFLLCGSYDTTLFKVLGDSLILAQERLSATLAYVASLFYEYCVCLLSMMSQHSGHWHPRFLSENSGFLAGEKKKITSWII